MFPNRLTSRILSSVAELVQKNQPALSLKSSCDAIRRRLGSGSHRSHNHRAQVVVHFRRRDSQAGPGLADHAADRGIERDQPPRRELPMKVSVIPVRELRPDQLVIPASANLRLASAQPGRGLRRRLARSDRTRSRYEARQVAAVPATAQVRSGQRPVGRHMARDCLPRHAGSSHSVHSDRHAFACTHRSSRRSPPSTATFSSRSSCSPSTVPAGITRPAPSMSLYPAQAFNSAMLRVTDKCYR